MASMVKGGRRGIVAGALLLSVAAAAALTGEQREWYRAQLGVPGVASPGFLPANDPMGDALVRWNRLRQSDSLPFADYASFLLAWPGWPGEAAMRKAAEKAIDDTTPPADVTRLLDRFPPLTGAGGVRYAAALLATGRADEARAAARAAWTSGVLSADDEAALFLRFGGGFTSDDQDRRMDRLLWSRATASAQRQLPRVSPSRAGLFDARLAMQTRAAGAAGKAAAWDAPGSRDAGFLADKARWLRDTNRWPEARALLARPLALEAPPLDPEAWLEVLLSIAKSAAADGQASTALAIARNADAAFAPGTDIRAQPLGPRDDYTSLVWLGAMTALKKAGRPADALALFDRYARASQTPSGQSRGWYWAGRAALAAGQPDEARVRFTAAASHADVFYGQLAAERLGRAIAQPAPAAAPVSADARAAFEASGPVRAARFLGEIGAWADQTAFIRAIAATVKGDAGHALAADLARSIGRPDLGVMVARAARSGGVSDFVPSGFPQLAVPPALAGDWVMIHAIARQESQFDRQAVSHAGARGLMQLMPGTARQMSGRLGLPYAEARLTADPQYNMMLGSSFFANLLGQYGGNHVLAVAAYNAGPGNVRKWLAANGDPRGGADVLDWIEAIPFTETRGYVQRVLENAVIYDALNPANGGATTRNRLSAYLGKSAPG